MCLVEGETGSYSETCVECGIDGTEEVSFKVEEGIDLKDEIPEAIMFLPFKTEQEVRLQGVCEVVAAHAFRSFIAPKRKLWNQLFPALCYIVSAICLLKFGLQS
jgi:hypothetical protein